MVCDLRKKLGKHIVQPSDLKIWKWYGVYRGLKKKEYKRKNNKIRPKIKGYKNKIKGC